jgi:hypothetical protein
MSESLFKGLDMVWRNVVSLAVPASSIGSLCGGLPPQELEVNIAPLLRTPLSLPDPRGASAVESIQSPPDFFGDEPNPKRAKKGKGKEPAPPMAKTRVPKVKPPLFLHKATAASPFSAFSSSSSSSSSSRVRTPVLLAPYTDGTHGDGDEVEEVEGEDPNLLVVDDDDDDISDDDEEEQLDSVDKQLLLEASTSRIDARQKNALTGSGAAAAEFGKKKSERAFVYAAKDVSKIAGILKTKFRGSDVPPVAKDKHERFLEKLRTLKEVRDLGGYTQEQFESYALSAAEELGCT